MLRWEPMLYDTAQIARLGGSWGVLGALVESDASARHPHMQRLRAVSGPMRDLADAVHFLCLLHGHHPGVIDHALGQARHPAEIEWIEAAAAGFAAERAFLVRLVAGAGPMPSTPGHAEAETAALGQRHALNMLAQSDRVGCATGAALALAIDWAMLRAVLDLAAERFGVNAPETALPPPEETLTVVDAMAERPAVERAMLFGAQQLLAQHRGLWDLLEARASARLRG